MNQDEIQNTIEKLLKLMNVTFEGVVKATSEDKTVFVIKSLESQILIGTRGAHIAALNHVVKRIVSKKNETKDEKTDFFVDVNDYHAKLTQEIKSKAEILAGRARSFKTNIEMDPMTSYERMIIHTLFQNSPDIKTESIGVGNNRRVVLKYTEPPTETY